MSARNQRSFPIFELTLVVALGLIAWAAFKLSDIGPVDTTPRALQHLRDQYFLISNRLDTNITRLDSLLKQAVDGKTAAAKDEFQKECHLNEWISEKRRLWIASQAELANEVDAIETARGTNQPGQTNDAFAELLDKIENAYTNYVRAAEFLLFNSDHPEATTRDKLPARQQAAQRARARLLSSVRESRMRGEAMNLAVQWSQTEFQGFSAQVHKVNVRMFVALVVLSFLSLFLVYKRKLAQSSAIIRQHKLQHREQQTTLDKLAHFGRLAQELAHEIKQPLTAINARAYTLQRSLNIGSEAHKDAAVIRSEIRRLDAIVKDFLELARPTEPRLMPITADQALQQVRDLMAPQLAQEEIEFKFECEEGLQLMADAHQLKQVLINLVKNAAESLEGHGTVSLRARRDTIGSNGESTEVALIEVEDTGPGIPPEIRQKIFDPFFSTKGDGTGLGLAIAARIIDKHDGKLEFDTELGKGTTFRIILPTCRREQPA